AEPSPNFLLNVTLAVIALEGAPGPPLQKASPIKCPFMVRSEPDIETGAVDAAEKPAATTARRRENHFDARDCAQLFLHSQCHLVHCTNAGAFSRGDIRVEFAFVHVTG